MTAKCHVVNIAGYLFDNDAEDAQTHWAEHPEDESGVYYCPIYRRKFGQPTHRPFAEMLGVVPGTSEYVPEDGPCDCPYCHKHLSDCRCDYT
jgi:hypothetical protein